MWITYLKQVIFLWIKILYNESIKTSYQKMPETKSKKLSILVAVLILFAGFLIGGFLIIKAKVGSANISEQFNYLIGNQNQPPKTESKDVDSDNDGLPDWQEKIYNTDPKNPDTDGDGYLDGEEVASGYDPLVKAPNDALPGTDTSKARPLPSNLTKALSLKLSQAVTNGTIKSFNSAGQPMNAEELQGEPGLEQAINEAVNQQIDDFTLPNILDSEIKISPQIGKEKALQYVDAMNESIGKISRADKTQSELQSFERAIASGDFSQLKENQKTYFDSYQKLKNVTVPEDLIFFHKGLLGVFWVTNNIYAAIENIGQDPLKSTIAIMQYANINQKLGDLTLQLLEKIKEY